MNLRQAITAVAALSLCVACGGPPDGFTTTEWETIQGMSPLPAVPADPTNKYADNPDAVAFGRRIFWEKRYAGPIVVADDGMNGGLGAAGETGKVSCGSCHFPEAHWADTRSKPNNLSVGVNRGTRNSPSLLNVAFYDWYTWAGRLDTLWTQGASAMESPDMVGNRCGIAHMLWDDMSYRTAYNALFDDDLPAALDPAAPDAARFPAACRPKAAGAADGPWEMMAADDRVAIQRVMSNLGKAIAAYERKLVSGNAPFDKYAAGDTKAISASAKRGLKLFIGEAFCVQCHQGPNFTDQKFHNLGVPQTGPNVPATDTGRFDDIPKMLSNPLNGKSQFSDDVAAGTKKLEGIMQQETDKGAFRTKNLRGCSTTGPYEHNGVFNTLREVVDFYAAGGGATPYTKDEKIKPLTLTDTQKEDLVEFLKTLTGDEPGAELGPPN